MSTSESSIPSRLPTYLYKILPSAPPEPLPDKLPLSELDQSDGFIHLSTSAQTPATASRFFSSHTHLWLLKLRYEDLVQIQPNGYLKWELAPGIGEAFPHLYEADLGRGNVVEVMTFSKGDEDWSEILGSLEP